MKDASLYVVLDLEYCYSGMTEGTPRPTHKNNRQIVQIAAIIFDMKTGKEYAKLDLVVRPTYEKQVGSFFTKLTGITQQQVDRGVSLEDGLRTLEDFIGNHPVLTYDKDWFVLHQNASYIDYTLTVIARPFVRIKHLLYLYGIDSSQYSSGSLYTAVGLDMKGHVHNALHDVRSLARSLFVLQNTHNISIEKATMHANAQSTDEYINSNTVGSGVLLWDIYEIQCDKPLHNVKLRGRIRKVALSNNITLLCENASDVENVVRFALPQGVSADSMSQYISTIMDGSRVVKVLSDVPNPVLSKLKVNKAERYDV